MRIFGFGGKIASEANLILAACKLLDVALLTDSEQFKLYAWMFISDSNEFSSFSTQQFVPFVDQLGIRAATESPIKVAFSLLLSSYLFSFSFITSIPSLSPSPLSPYYLITSIPYSLSPLFVLPLLPFTFITSSPLPSPFPFSPKIFLFFQKGYFTNKMNKNQMLLGWTND